MEADWERTDAYLPLDLAGAEALLLPLGLRPRAVALVTEGKVNTNYRVETGTGPVHLRLHHGSDATVDLEAALSKRLQGGVRTPRLLGRGARFLVYDWLPGQSLERALAERRSLPYERIARDLADVRLALDEIRFPAYGFLREDLTLQQEWRSAAASFFAYLRLLVEPPTRDHAFAARVEEIADHAEPRIMAIEGPPALAHGDFKPTNLLVDEDGLVGVVDWEFAHAGTRLADVGQLLRHPETLPEGFAAAFRDPLGLDDDAVLLARTLDLANLVDLRYRFLTASRALGEIEARIYRLCDEYEVRFGLD